MTPAVFQFDGAVVRTFSDDNGEPWFNANDVCAVLGYRNPRMSVERHCRESGVAKRDMGVVTGQKANGSEAVQQVEQTFINEGNLYRLIIKSRKPEAERFEAWVCDEVLPSIRKTGGYTHPQAKEAALTGNVTVQLADYVGLLKHRDELARHKASSSEAQSKLDIACALIREGCHSREEIAAIAGMGLHFVDFIHADLCREAARRGLPPFSLRNS